MILISTTGPTALILFYLDKSLGAAMLSSVRKQLLPYHEGKEISASEYTKLKKKKKKTLQ